MLNHTVEECKIQNSSIGWKLNRSPTPSKLVPRSYTSTTIFLWTSKLLTTCAMSHICHFITCIPLYDGKAVTIRDHSFLWLAKFRAETWNLSFCHRNEPNCKFRFCRFLRKTVKFQNRCIYLAVWYKQLAFTSHTSFIRHWSIISIVLDRLLALSAKVIQGQKPTCDFLIVINTNLHPVSRTIFKLLQIIGQICSFNRGEHVFNTLVQGECLNSGPWNSTPKKLEESLYRTVLIYWQIIISFCHNPRVWQTYRQMSTARARL